MPKNSTGYNRWLDVGGESRVPPKERPVLRGGTFNYSSHNVCGGSAGKAVFNTRKPTPPQKYTPPPPPAARYVTKEKEAAKRVAFLAAKARAEQRDRILGRMYSFAD